MDKEQLEATILLLQERRTELDAARVNALAQLNSILGGIAEMDYLSEQLAAQIAELEARESIPQTGGSDGG